MTTPTPNYQKHYRNFCIELHKNPDLKFSSYCEQAGVPWRRLYDWMARRKISLKRLYAGMGRDLTDELSSDAGEPACTPGFIPVKVEKPHKTSASTAGSICVSVLMPSGVRIELSGCTAGDIAVILGGPLGSSHV